MTKENQLIRLGKVNELVKTIASTDHKFFSYTDRESGQERIGRFEFQGNKLFWIDEYKMARIYPYGSNAYKFSHGGTLWDLVQEFRAWIIGNSNKYENSNGLYATYWGYTEEGMRKVRRKAREVGYIK